MLKKLTLFVRTHGWATTAHLLGHRDTWRLKKWISGPNPRGVPVESKEQVKSLLKGGTR